MTQPKKLNLSELNEALRQLEQPIYCRHCHTEIGWTGVNWIHKHQPVDHLAEPWSEQLPPQAIWHAIKDTGHAD